MTFYVGAKGQPVREKRYRVVGYEPIDLTLEIEMVDPRAEKLYHAMNKAQAKLRDEAAKRRAKQNE